MKANKCILDCVLHDNLFNYMYLFIKSIFTNLEKKLVPMANNLLLTCCSI